MSHNQKAMKSMSDSLSTRDTSVVNNAVLQRLIQEVKQEKHELSCVGGRYDRTHNKHNR